jgi:subtilisin
MQSAELRRALDAHLGRLARRKLAPVDVAVIDSGIDASHPDLTGHVHQAFRVQSDATGTRLVSARKGVNQDAFGHGTAVASIIRRVAPNARLIDVRIVSPDDIFTGDALIAGLTATVERKWKVANISLAASRAVARHLMPLCERAHFQGQVLVAAQRNLAIEDDGYPAAFSSVFGVTSKDIRATYEYFFDDAAAIEWQAAGEKIPVAASGGGYTLKAGTSFAAPAIAGICALLLGAFPRLTPFEIRTVLKAHARAATPSWPDRSSPTHAHHGKPHHIEIRRHGS